MKRKRLEYFESSNCSTEMLHDCFVRHDLHGSYYDFFHANGWRTH